MGKKSRAQRKIIRVKRKRTTTEELVETAASLGMTPREYTAYLNQRNRQNKEGRQKGFRGSYNSKYSDL